MAALGLLLIWAMVIAFVRNSNLQSVAYVTSFYAILRWLLRAA